MRILFLSDNFPPESNALTARLYGHAQHWLKMGHEVTVVTCAPNFPEGKLFPGYRNRWRQVECLDGIRVVRVKTYMTANEGFVKRMLDFVSFMVMGAFFALFERKPDVVVATSPQFFCAVAGWLVSALRRKPLVLEIRDLWPDSIVAVGAMRRNLPIRVLERIEIFLYKRAKLIVGVTEGVCDGVRGKGISSEKVRLIANGVDLNRFRPMSKDVALVEKYGLADKFVVGFVGTHGLAYALDMVVDIATALRDVKNIVFMFVGSGINRASIESLVKSRSLDNVRMVPRQPGSEMPRTWALCDLAIIPLRNSDFFRLTRPAKMFEAMAMGVPILFSGVSGEATEIINASQAGVCIPPEDLEAHAHIICQLASDKDAMTRMSEAGVVSAARYSRASSAEEMVCALRAACGVVSPCESVDIDDSRDKA